jgi:hypothetical protein
MLSLGMWTWIGIVVWVVFMVAMALGVALSLCRMSADANRHAEALHRQASRARELPPKEAA